MKGIDAVIDQAPTKQMVKELADLRIRNLDCFRELQALNDTGAFLYIHPLITHYSLRAKLENTLKTNPEEFLNNHHGAKENVKRYSSYLKSTKRTAEQKKNDRENLTKWREELDIYKEILESKKQ